MTITVFSMSLVPGVFTSCGVEIRPCLFDIMLRGPDRLFQGLKMIISIYVIFRHA